MAHHDGRPPATRTDLKRVLADYRARVGTVDVHDLPARRYLAVDGHGDPNTDPRYAQALRALYPVAYRTRALSRRELGRDYVVPPLEGLWWAEDMDAFTRTRTKADWDWTMLLLIPSWVEDGVVDAAIAMVRDGEAPARLGDVTIRALTEGRCVQTLHVGSFDDEGPVLEHLHHDVIPALGLRLAGTHHEIYLSDARRTAPERRRTILRQPVVEASAASGS